MISDDSIQKNIDVRDLPAPSAAAGFIDTKVHDKEIAKFKQGLFSRRHSEGSGGERSFSPHPRCAEST